MIITFTKMLSKKMWTISWFIFDNDCWIFDDIEWVQHLTHLYKSWIGLNLIKVKYIYLTWKILVLWWQYYSCFSFPPTNFSNVFNAKCNAEVWCCKIRFLMCYIISSTKALFMCHLLHSWYFGFQSVNESDKWIF